MESWECEECGQGSEDEVTKVIIDAEPCGEYCRYGCEHPTHDVILCSDCAEPSSFDADDRAVRRAESGYCE